MLVCAGACVCGVGGGVGGGGGGGARMYTLRIFSMGKILRFTNTFIIIITVTAPGKTGSVLPTDTN